ncbi:hypothetical protein [Limnoglobus roseus]|uniref:hypothetical protein n=1 Tax=Limnoglobus roseus TaxID=2598579 RepID=UPI0011EB6A48|nr:hypothetical protein [Limnoglobus roseus]
MIIYRIFSSPNNRRSCHMIVLSFGAILGACILTATVCRIGVDRRKIAVAFAQIDDATTQAEVHRMMGTPPINQLALKQSTVYPDFSMQELCTVAEDYWDDEGRIYLIRYYKHAEKNCVLSKYKLDRRPGNKLGFFKFF